MKVESGIACLDRVFRELWGFIAEVVSIVAT